MKFIFTALILSISLSLSAQWQQRVKYTMNVDMNVQTNRFTGTQRLEYWNNSPDTLDKVFYHLYWNAFQPGSMMDERSRRQGTVVLGEDRQGNKIGDWDARVQDRILNLKPEEQGWQKISSLKMDGRPQKFTYHETILEVQLDRPIAPKGKVTFDMEFEAQVPLQVRRSGRDNPTTGVRYTMTQWYPKLAEYDEDGWHPNPYIAREFYGVWGDYDVTIKMDKAYVIGGTGNLQNAAAVGHGYEAKGTTVKRPAGDKLTWRFLAPNVHDFAWAADPDYKHITRTIPGGPTIHVLYNGTPTRAQAGSANYEQFAANWDAQWTAMADAAVTVYPFIKEKFGAYPYEQYSFIHGGDGGMEYPMATMLVSSSLGTAFHEWMHTWYQMLMGTNESLYSWMDEGFTEWSTNLVEDYYRRQMQAKTMHAAARRRADSVALAGRPAYHAPNYGGYLALARSGREEPLTTHADYFNTNYAYSSAAYNKGAVFLEQLGYVIGAPVRDRLMLEYYRQWRFRHPDAGDFLRLAEKVSGLQLDWYGEYWINSTKTIDYGVDSLWQEGSATQIRLRRVGMVPMPIDLKVTFKDGTSEWHYVPMYLMFGGKPAEPGQEGRKEYAPWKWTHATYSVQTARPLQDIVRVEIDPSYRMADLERKNNLLELKW